MAGHSQFKNIMHRKAAQDKKRGKAFTKMIREITTAARTGLPDPAANPRLRAALAAARAASMPRDTIERAIKRGSGEDGGAAYEDVRYEGYAAGGVAVIVETLTDNRNRTAGEVRSLFVKYGGNLGETGSVSFAFTHVAEILYQADAGSADKILSAALDAGADDVVSSEDGHIIYAPVAQLARVRESLEQQLGEALAAGLAWRPHNTMSVDVDTATKIDRLVDALEDCDDVQKVFTNLDQISP